MNIVERKGPTHSNNVSSDYENFLGRNGMVSPESRGTTPRNLLSAGLNIKIDDSFESSTFVKTQNKEIDKVIENYISGKTMFSNYYPDFQHTSDPKKTQGYR